MIGALPLTAHLIGKGLIVIPAESVEEYKKLLVKYYEDDNETDITDFLRDKALIEL